MYVYTSLSDFQQQEMKQKYKEIGLERLASVVFQRFSVVGEVDV